MRFKTLLPWILLAGVLDYVFSQQHWWPRQALENASPTFSGERAATPVPSPQVGVPGPGSYAGAVNAAAPAVVNIYTTQKVRQRNPLGQRLRAPGNRRRPGWEQRGKRQHQHRRQRRIEPIARHRLQRCRIEQRRIGRTVEPAPAERQHRCHHHREEQPAIDDMIKPGRALDRGEIGRIDCTEGAYAVGQHGHHQRHHQEHRAPAPGHETDIGDEDAIRDHRNHKLRARARLGHFEIAIGDGDQHPIDVCRHAEQMQQRHRDGDRRGLKRPLQPFAKRHQEQRISQRKQQRARDIGPEQSHHCPLQHQHNAKMPSKRHAAGIAQQPPNAAQRDQRQARCPGDGCDLGQPGAALPNKPCHHGRNEQAMPKGRAGPPQRRERAHIGGEQ